MINNIFRIFHIVIISTVFLYFSGCGYKSAPIYKESRKIDTNNTIMKKNKG